MAEANNLREIKPGDVVLVPCVVKNVIYPDGNKGLLPELTLATDESDELFTLKKTPIVAAIKPGYGITFFLKSGLTLRIEAQSPRKIKKTIVDPADQK